MSRHSFTSPRFRSAALLLLGVAMFASGCGLLRHTGAKTTAVVISEPADPDSFDNAPIFAHTLVDRPMKTPRTEASGYRSEHIRFNNNTDHVAPAASGLPGRSSTHVASDGHVFQSADSDSTPNIFGEFGGFANSARQFGAGESLTQVTFSSEGADSNPDLDPTGEFLVYSSTQHNVNADLYMKRVDGSTVTQLTNDAGEDIMPAFSPDGRKIAFASNRSGSWDLYLMDASGGPAVQLTNDPAQELHPSWSPDGRIIVFSRLNETAGRWEIWIVETSNPSVRKFIAAGLFPEWCPAEDSNLIVFQKPRERGSRLFGIWTIQYEDGQALMPTEIVSSQNAAAINPTWSPDGSMIAFVAVPNPESIPGDRLGLADLWVVAADGSSRVNLTNGEYANLQPCWGANHRIYLVCNRSGSENVWSLQPDRALAAARLKEAGSDEPSLTADATPEEVSADTQP